jgi:hypothetical protein
MTSRERLHIVSPNPGPARASVFLWHPRSKPSMDRLLRSGGAGLAPKESAPRSFKLAKGKTVGALAFATEGRLLMCSTRGCTGSTSTRTLSFDLPTLITTLSATMMPSSIARAGCGSGLMTWRSGARAACSTVSIGRAWRTRGLWFRRVERSGIQPRWWHALFQRRHRPAAHRLRLDRGTGE